MATSLTSPGCVFAADKAIIAARKALALSRQFATDFSDDAVKEGTTLKIPVFSTGASGVFDKDSNNYETIDGSVAYVPVTFTHVKNTFGFDDNDFLIGARASFWGNAGAAAGASIAAKVQNLLGAKIKQADMTSTAISGGAKHVMASVTKAAVAKLRESCAKVGIAPAQAVVLLEPGYFADLLALLDANVYGGAEAVRTGVIPGLFGFKAVCEFSDFADAGTKGAVVPEDGLAIAGRVIPVQGAKVYDELGTTTDEVSGIVLGVRRHTAPATGDNFLTVEAVVGAALVQPAKCFYIAAS